MLVAVAGFFLNLLLLLYLRLLLLPLPVTLHLQASIKPTVPSAL